MGTLAVVELAAQSGVAKDKFVNTYAIAEAAPWIGNGLRASTYHSALSRIYTTALGAPVSASLGSLLARAISRDADAHTIKLYDITDHLDGSPHGSPYSVSTFTMPAASTVNSLPGEVALCLTLEANNRDLQFVETPDGSDPDAKPDRPRQRYTGRIYFGPFISDVNDASPPNYHSRPTTTVATALRMAVQRAASEIDTASGDEASIGIWSRKDQAIRGARQFRTDDAWDTQRRRGPQPTGVLRLASADLVPEIELGA